MMEERISLKGSFLFQLHIDCPRIKNPPAAEHLAKLKSNQLSPLPDPEDLTAEDTFASLSCGWSPEGLFFEALVQQGIKKVMLPFEKGDSLEIFLDTRHLQNALSIHRFCHHFYFLPEAFEGQQAAEVTKFRNEERHPLCNPKDLKVETQKKPHYYSMKIFIPAESLHGFDPEQFPKLGLAYRLNRAGGHPQSLSPKDAPINHSPALWSTLKLQKES
jgi:hypothetical protein